MADAIYISTWESFQPALAETLSEIQPWLFLSVRLINAPQRLVRCAMEDARFYIEAMGNQRLPPAHRVPPEGQQKLRRAGWSPHSDGNWWVGISWPATTVEYQRLSGLVVIALRDVFGAGAPTELETEYGRHPMQAPEGTVARSDAPAALLCPRRLEKEVEAQLAADSALTEAAEGMLAKGLADNDEFLRQIAANDRQAVGVAEEYLQVSGLEVLSNQGCMAETGMRHAVGVERDENRVQRLVVVEAAAQDEDIGSRKIGKLATTWADRGTIPYLRWMLDHDPHLLQLLDSDRRITEGLRSGTLPLEYFVLRVSLSGEAVLEQISLASLGQRGILR
ncbi:MAG: TY-Chap domain-containing protein [Candidatus Dormibacteraceae bacterium]